ncbi:MAG: tRNA 2-thiocytidine biosynthesis protein TtcA, partial [Clostridia bacterium]|nr:tRNA 2-thiocytidine biosynthesis protein TtcA [Clostridia bacterium]
LIRPLYCIHEDDIIAWARYNHLEFIQCACRFTEQAASADHEHLSKRKAVKEMLRKMRSEDPDIEQRVFSSIHAVNIDTFPGWKAGGQEHSFLETYDQKAEASE